MSLQEIERSHIQSGTAGLEKDIHGSSKKMILDILQVTQYSKPIESTVRELASNAVDSQREKEIAIQILQGKAKPEDFYMQREGAQYEDSKWKPEYFDLDWLDQKNNDVVIRYEEHEGTGFTDKFIIEDHGVGLGMPRLSGYFSLGYSSKRNTKHALGAFGLGAKVSLSTGVPYYTLETAHNGKKFLFNCYSYKVDSLVPRFNLETGEENPKINIGTASDPYEVHYIKTKEKNFSRIITGVKRHNAQKFIQAVKHQLLYFKGVKFEYINQHGSKQDISFLAKVLYNSPSLLVSDTREFSRPHIVVVKEKGSDFGVSYGNIDFQELEMPQLFGTVGFKCPIKSVVENADGTRAIVQNGISVTPSRESVIWDEDTREYIQSIIQEAQNEASELISKELKEKDFFKWIQKASQTFASLGGYYDNSVISQLAKIIDKQKLEAVYPENPKVKFNQSPSAMFKGMTVRVVTRNTRYNSRTGKNEVSFERDDCTSWSSFNYNAVYLLDDADGKHSFSKDNYLNHLHNGNFISIRKESDENIAKAIADSNVKWTKAEVEAAAEKVIKIRDLYWDIMSKQKTVELRSYSAVEVPAKFNVPEGTDPDDTSTSAPTVVLSPAELREKLGKTVCYTYAMKVGSYGTRELGLTKKEPILGDLDKIKGLVVYGTQDDDEKLKAIAQMNLTPATAIQGSLPDFFDESRIYDENNKLITIVRFSQRNLKFIKHRKNFVHVDKYFWNHAKETFAIGDTFVSFFTAKYLAERLEKLKFLSNFEQFNGELAMGYAALNTYVKANYSQYQNRTLEGLDAFKTFLDMADRGSKFQLFLEEGAKTEEEILEKSKSLFGETSKFTSAKVLDMSVVNLIWELESFAEPIDSLFNSISFLTNAGKPLIDDKSARLINELLSSQNLISFSLSDESKQILKNLTQN